MKNPKKNKRRKRTPDTPAQKRARTQIIIGWVVLLLVGVLALDWLSGFMGMRTTAEELGRGRATITACDRTIDGARCTARLTEWTGQPAHTIGESIVVLSNSSLSGEIEIAARTQNRSRIVTRWWGPGTTSEQHSAEVFVKSSDYVMPDGLRLLYFFGFGLAWLTLMWWLGKLWFSYRSRS